MLENIHISAHQDIFADPQVPLPMLMYQKVFKNLKLKLHQNHEVGQLLKGQNLWAKNPRPLSSEMTAEQLGYKAWLNWINTSFSYQPFHSRLQPPCHLKATPTSCISSPELSPHWPHSPQLLPAMPIWKCGVIVFLSVRCN